MIGKSKQAAEVLATLRAGRESEARAEFARVQHQAAAIRRRLTQLQESLARQTQHVRDLLSRGTTGDLRWYREAVSRVRAQIVQEEALLAEASRQAAALRQRLLAARAARRAAAVLQDRQASRRRTIRHRQEVKRMDDEHALHLQARRLTGDHE